MIGVVIGRFQVHEVHSGHMALLNWVQAHHAQMAILIGVRPTPPTLDNPLDYRSREAMLRLLFPDAVILPVVDEPTDEGWSRQVDRLIQTSFPYQGAVLYGGRDSFIPHYKGHFQTRALDLGGDASSTEIRKLLAERPINSVDFRAGVVYAVANQPPRQYLAVDIAVWRTVGHVHSPECRLGERFDACTVMPGPQDGTFLWLGQKAGEPWLRFPGGHVDPTDATTDAAARRELQEESGLTIEGPLTFLGDFVVDDWRTRKVPDAYYRTLLWGGEYSFGVGRAADDLIAGGWYNLARPIPITPEHAPLLMRVKQHLGLLTPEGAGTP